MESVILYIHLKIEKEEFVFKLWRIVVFARYPAKSVVVDGRSSGITNKQHTYIIQRV